MSSTWQGKIANCWSCSKTDQTRCNSDDQPYEHQLPFPYTKQELSKWAVQTGCTQQHCLCYKYPKLKSKHRNSQTAKHRTQNTYPGPKSMRLIATHNGGSKNGRTNNSLIYYKSKFLERIPDTTPWCTTSHEFHPVPATRTHNRQRQHTFHNISRPLFRTTYKAITFFSPDATMLTGPKPCFPSEGMERRELL